MRNTVCTRLMGIAYRAGHLPPSVPLFVNVYRSDRPFAMPDTFGRPHASREIAQEAADKAYQRACETIDFHMLRTRLAYRLRITPKRPRP